MNKQGAALLSVISNTLLVGCKLSVGILMGSVSVISEAIHSGIDLLASVVAFFSIRKAGKPADLDHPYGHGKFENISGFFEAILIFVAAGLIIAEAVKKLIHPGEVGQVDWGIAVMGVSAIINTVVSMTLFRVAKKEGSIALEADAMHLSVDVFTSLGVFVGLILIRFTHWGFLDPVIALVVAVMILKGSWDLTSRSLEDLADKALPAHDLALVEKVFQTHSRVLGYHKMRSRRSGNRRELDIHIKIDGATRVDDAHVLCHEIEAEIKAILPGTYVVIHIEPWKAVAASAV